jgi:hypothetical protein
VNVTLTAIRESGSGTTRPAGPAPEPTLQPQIVVVVDTGRGVEAEPALRRRVGDLRHTHKAQRRMSMRSNTRAVLWIPGFAVGVMLALPAAALSQSDTKGSSPARPASTNAQTVAAEDLSDNPQNYYGKTVTVRQDVENVIGSNLFTIDDGEFFGTSPNILVFAPDAEATPTEDNTVTVTGLVRKFTQAELQREYGWGWGAYPWGVGYYGYPWYGPVVGPEYFVRFDNRPVIIASSVMTASGRELVARDSSRNGTVGTSGSASAKASAGNAGDPITNLAPIAGGSASQLAGRDVHLSNVTVNRLAGNRAFWTRTTQGQDVFVALDDDIRQPNVHRGETVTISGEVRKTTADRKHIDARTWGLSDDEVSQIVKAGVFVRATALMHDGAR